MSQNVIEQNIVDILTNNYMPYTAYVIMERALPEIDGFKPSQRRILYTMMKMGLQKGSRKKSQGVVGSTMFLHPHGDMAIYETLVRMSKDSESLLIPFIDSKGNFGKQYSRDMQYASARYTEVRLAPIAKELFADIEKNTVDMVDNYDGTMKEPRLLPVTFPSILVNPQSGIANGMASNIASFNLNEVIDFTIAFIKNPKNVIVSDYIKAPDFPTGGCIVRNNSAFNNIFNTGRGSFSIRATYRFEKNSIVFEELPYTTTFEAIIDKISNLVKEGKLKDVVDVDNIYGIKSKGIEVTVKNNTNKEALVEKLFKMTPLQSSFSCNFNIVVNGKPQVLGVKQIIQEWLKFRANAIKRGAEFDRDKKAHKRHLLLALKQVLLDVDKAVKIIRDTKKNSEVIANLMNAFGIDEVQAEYVAEIKLRHLNKEYLVQRIAEIETLEKEIEQLEDLINNKSTIAKFIVKQLQDIKETYGQERKSQIIDINELPEVEKEAVTIDNYNIKIFATEAGYIKKIPLTSLRGGFEIKVKDGDKIVKEVETTNNSDILIFTDKQNVYKYKSYEIEDHKPSSLGEYLPSLLGLKDEKIVFVTVTNDYKGNLIVAFDDGKVAKIEMSAYETKQNRSMLKNAYADKNAIYFNHILDDIDILAVSSIDKALIFNTAMVNAKSSKTTIGVQIMKSKNDSNVKAYYSLENIDEDKEYYRTFNAGIGKYLRKGDFESLLDKQ
jgi:DNA gyrase subunit A